jgi:hypothetical protein
MKRDIVTRMCEDLLKLSKERSEPFDSKMELYDKIGVPFSGVNIDNEETEPPRSNSEDSISGNKKGH